MQNIKIKNLAFIALVGIMLTGVFALAIVLLDNRKAISEPSDQNSISAQDGYSVASVSKGTILLLLAVGVVGFLGIGRKKKNKASLAQNNGSNEKAEQKDYEKDT